MPFIRHPEHEDFLEEGWLHEAILETYIPLLWTLEALIEEGVDYRITISLSPTLVAQLADPLLRSRFARRLDNLTDLAGREVHRTPEHPEFEANARLYQARFARARRDYRERWHGDLIAAFRRLEQAGRVELITCGATHGYLPLLSENWLAARAQVLVAVAHHRRFFGELPRGFWLPECGYFPGLDEVLAEAGVEYSFVETHAIDHASRASEYGVYAPLRSPNGVLFFGRDPESTRQVWSSTEGYPGDPDYREYYRDVGFDLDREALGACAHPMGIGRNTGIKYHRVTGSDEKQPYVRKQALLRAREHGKNFFSNRRRQVGSLREKMDRAPLVVAPYDAELFGHWWYEGPEWLGHVLRNTASDGEVLGLSTPADYLARHDQSMSSRTNT
jgi:1,4-alpha-glucan branching enzyme